MTKITLQSDNCFIFASFWVNSVNVNILLLLIYSVSKGLHSPLSMIWTMLYKVVLLRNEKHSFILCFMSLWQLIIFIDNNVKCSSVFVFKSICIYLKVFWSFGLLVFLSFSLLVFSRKSSKSRKSRKSVCLILWF